MSGHRPFSDLKKGWSAERLAENAARKAELAAELVSLEQLREGLGISQEELANVMDVQQPAISKLVRRPDMKDAFAELHPPGLRHRSADAIGSAHADRPMRGRLVPHHILFVDHSQRRRGGGGGRAEQGDRRHGHAPCRIILSRSDRCSAISPVCPG